MDLLEKMKKARENLKDQVESKKTPEVKITPEKKKKPLQEKSSFIDVLESDEITMDEARAQYIVICKKKPKHDSIQTKNWLINEVMKVLEQSKTNKKGVDK